MLPASGSSLPAVEAFIGLIILASLRTQAYADFLVCEVPQNFTLESPYYETSIKITQAELHVYLDKESFTAVGEDQYSDPHLQSTMHRLKIHSDSVTIYFRGNIKEAMKYGNDLPKEQRRFATESMKISEHYDGSLSGAVTYNGPTVVDPMIN